MYELTAQVVVSALTYSAKPWFTTRRVLPRDKPDPCRQRPARCEVATIIDGGNQSGGNHRTHSGKC